MNYAVPSDELPPHSPGRRGVRNNNNNNNPAINSPRFSSSRGAAPGSPRQITGYTSMGSPIYGWDRSQSQGTTPYGLALPKSPYQMPSRSLSATLDGAPPQHDGLHGPAIPLLPPEPTETQKAMEAAAAKERQRSKELEEQELNLSADRLREILKQERHRMARMAADLAKFRSTAVQSQLEAEMIEEGRINGLMRRLEYLQQEKGRIIVELEREEEMLTNTLQKKLDEVRREKSVLEEQIEKEKKSHSTLQNHLSGLRDSHHSKSEGLENQDEMEEET